MCFFSHLTCQKWACGGPNGKFDWPQDGSLYLKPVRHKRSGCPYNPYGTFSLTHSPIALAMFFRTLVFLLAATLVAGQTTDAVCMPGWSWVRYRDSSFVHSLNKLSTHKGEQLTRPKPMPHLYVYRRSLWRWWVLETSSDYYTMFTRLHELQAYNLPALPSGDYYYVGPWKYEDNYCQCSTVTFSLVSACGLCQNGSVLPWVIHFLGPPSSNHINNV